jgi:hypothetical protein
MMQFPIPEKSIATAPSFEIERQQPSLDGFAGMTAADRASRAEILHRAFSIWENSGRPNGSEMAHWLQAEAEVLSEV